MQPYTLAASHLEDTAWRRVTRQASGAVVLAGVICGGLFTAVAAIVGASSDLGRAFLVIAVLAPGLALQEFWRVASFAAQRARTAAANDAFWAIAQAVAFGVLLSGGSVTAAGSLVAWGVGAWLAAGLGILQLSVTPKVDRTAVRWAREWARVGAWFTAVSTTFALGLLGSAGIIAGELGKAALGLFQIVQNLFGPIQLLTIGLESIFLPHLVRIIRRTRENGLQAARRYSLVMTVAVVAYGLVLLVIAHAVVTTVFSSAFAAATSLVLPTLIAFGLDAAASGATLQLRAHASGGRLLAAQLAATVTRVGAVAVLASVGGLHAAVWGLVIGSGVGALAMWTQVWIGTTDQSPERSLQDAGESLAHG